VGPPSVELDKLVERMTDFYNMEENREVYRPKEVNINSHIIHSCESLNNSLFSLSDI
jgi:hypothetical protein